MDSEIKTTVILSVEVVLMRKGGSGYHSVLAKLASLYDYELIDCFENPKALRDILKQVYDYEFQSIIDEIELELTEFLDDRKVDYFLTHLKND